MTWCVCSHNSFSHDRSNKCTFFDTASWAECECSKFQIRRENDMGKPEETRDSSYEEAEVLEEIDKTNVIDESKEKHLYIDRYVSDPKDRLSTLKEWFKEFEEKTKISVFPIELSCCGETVIWSTIDKVPLVTTQMKCGDYAIVWKENES
jgi:hypothetical protein